MMQSAPDESGRKLIVGASLFVLFVVWKMQDHPK